MEAAVASAHGGLATLPGGEWDLFVPARGKIVAVVGVAFDDILEVHAAPNRSPVR